MNKQIEIKNIIDERLEQLRKLMKNSIRIKERNSREFVLYFAIREIEDLKIKILNTYDRTKGEPK